MTDILDLTKIILRIVEKSMNDPTPRKNFSKDFKKLVRKSQKNKCSKCEEKLEEETIEYHHIDGNRSNNSLNNCEALCPNCHAKKTRENRTN